MKKMDHFDEREKHKFNLGQHVRCSSGACNESKHPDSINGQWWDPGDEGIITGLAGFALVSNVPVYQITKTNEQIVYAREEGVEINALEVQIIKMRKEIHGI